MVGGDCEVVASDAPVVAVTVDVVCLGVSVASTCDPAGIGLRVRNKSVKPKKAATTIDRWSRSLPCRLLFPMKIQVIVFILLQGKYHWGNTAIVK